MFSRVICSASSTIGEAEGIGIGIRYGCLVSTWPWAKKFLSDDFISKNALEARNNCFHLYLNENYTHKEINDIIKSILKVEKYLTAKTKKCRKLHKKG